MENSNKVGDQTDFLLFSFFFLKNMSFKHLKLSKNHFKTNNFFFHFPYLVSDGTLELPSHLATVKNQKIKRSKNQKIKKSKNQKIKKSKNKKIKKYNQKTSADLKINLFSLAP